MGSGVPALLMRQGRQHYWLQARCWEEEETPGSPQVALWKQQGTRTRLSSRRLRTGAPSVCCGRARVRGGRARRAWGFRESFASRAPAAVHRGKTARGCCPAAAQWPRGTTWHPGGEGSSAQWRLSDVRSGRGREEARRRRGMRGGGSTLRWPHPPSPSHAHAIPHSPSDSNRRPGPAAARSLCTRAAV